MSAQDLPEAPSGLHPHQEALEPSGYQAKSKSRVEVAVAAVAKTRGCRQNKNNKSSKAVRVAQMQTYQRSRWLLSSKQER